MAQRWARIWFGVTALVALAGVATQTVMVASWTGGHFTSPAGRMVNELFFFTIESNLLIGVTALLLARRPDRSSRGFAVLWAAGLVGIVITAVVYHAVLAGIVHMTGWWLVTNQLLHTVVPLLAIAGWLAFGPRGLASWRVATLALAYPALFLAVTLVRGALVGWYPYPFVDVNQLGYPRVLLNALVIALLFLAVGAVVAGADRWLTRRAGTVTRDATDPA